MIHLKVVEEIQDGGRLETRKTTILRLILYVNLNKKAVLLVLRNFSCLCLKYKVIFFIITRKIYSSICHLCHQSPVIEIYVGGGGGGGGERVCR